MITRDDYMSKRATHAAYYRDVNHAAGIRITDPAFLARVRAAIAKGDTFLNSIPLREWDERVNAIKPALSRALKERGDFYSLGGGVCALKRAARDAAETAD